MIRFICDSCGKDISDKVLDSVRQFYGRSYFAQELSNAVTGEYHEHSHNGPQEGNHHLGPLRVEVRLLEELIRIIHALAWNRASAAMHCSSCAMKHRTRKKAKVVTMFTKIKLPRNPSGDTGDNYQAEMKKAM